MWKLKQQATIFLLVWLSVTQVLGQTVIKPTACGTTLGCYSDCTAAGCSFVVSWSRTGNNAVYTLTSTVTPNQGNWIAVGFSNDSIMHDDDVLGCAIFQSGTFAQFNAYTETLHSTPPMHIDTAITLNNSSIQNNVLTCIIQRPVSAGPNRRVSLDTAWTLLFATGPASNSPTQAAAITWHGENNRHVSAIQVNVNDTKDVPVAVPSTGPTTVPTTPTPNRTINKPSGCGTSLGCFSDCQGGTCSYIVSWSRNAVNATYTFTSTVTPNQGNWIAVAFSNDSKMNNDDVIGCASSPAGQIVKFTAHTPDHQTPIMHNDSEISLISNSLQNDVLACTIQRPVSAGENGRVNLDTAWTLFFAKGQATGTTQNFTILFHNDDRHISARPVATADNVDVLASGAVQPPAQPNSARTIPKTPECGSTIGCFSDCVNSFCSFLLSWKPVGNTTAQYILKTSIGLSPGAWTAVAFSTDTVMRDDDVIGCARDTSGSNASFSATTPYHSTPQPYDDTGRRLIDQSYQNGILSCTIERPILGVEGGRVDVNKTWILFFAKGPATFSATQQATIQFHQNKYISSKEVSIYSVDDLGSQDADSPLVKAHGSLMIAAWIFLASIGIVLARYYKPVWSGLMCSEKVWFQMHRLCMILVFCCTAAGFIIIFVDVDGYSNIQEDRQFLVGHPIIGIIVMILTVLNPVMAIFRCHPGTPKRPIFNWAHFGVGTSAHILGVVNIFFGVLLSRSDVPYYLVYILGAYVAWQIFVELLLEAISCFGRRIDRSDSYELSSEDHHKQRKVATDESSGTILAKRIILIIHCIIVAAFAAVLIGLLNAGKGQLGES